MEFWLKSIDYIELVSVLLSLIVVLMGAKRKMSLWPLSMVAMVLSGYIHFQVELYAKTGLCIIRFFTACYGWYHWRYGGKLKTKPLITHITRKEFVGGLLVGAISTYIISKILVAFKQDSFRYIDAFHASFALLASIALARKKIEAWFLFLILDLNYLRVYFYKKLPFFFIKYTVYLFLAVYGYVAWNKALKNQCKSKKST